MGILATYGTSRMLTGSGRDDLQRGNELDAVLLLAIGVDYGLHVVKRVEETGGVGTREHGEGPEPRRQERRSGPAPPWHRLHCVTIFTNLGFYRSSDQHS